MKRALILLGLVVGLSLLNMAKPQPVHADDFGYPSDGPIFPPAPWEG